MEQPLSAKDYYPAGLTPADINHINAKNAESECGLGVWVETPVSLRVFMEHDEAPHTPEFAFDKFLSISGILDECDFVLEDIEPDYVGRLRRVIEKLEIEIERKDSELRYRSLYIKQLQREIAG